MEATTGVIFRRVNCVAGAGVGAHSHHRNSAFSCSSSKPSMLGFSSMGRKELGLCLKSSGFCDEGHLEYYSSGKIRCGKKEKNKVKDEALKKTKKKLKLLKGLSKDLSTLTEMGFGFDLGSDHGLADRVQGRTISEATELLLGQLQQLRAEEKELKRKRKEDKALMKMDKATQVRGLTNCNMSSSSSSSESSDDECGNLVDMKSLKCATLAPPPTPQACDNATIFSPGISTTIDSLTLPQPPIVDTSLVIPNTPQTSSEASTEGSTSLEVTHPEISEQNGDVGSSIKLGSSIAAVAAAATTNGAKKIEVCMGGKCKKSGAAAILEEFQKVVGTEGAVIGCKCMGKCKVGPNVKVSASSSTSFDGFSVSATPSNNSSLCIGVGLDDVSKIAVNFLGRYQQEVGLGLASAVS